MSGVRDFQSYQSVEAAERAAKAESEMEIREAINNHADNLTHLNTHHEQMHADVVKLKDQMDAVLDSLTQINRRLDQSETCATYQPSKELGVCEECGHNLAAHQRKARRVSG